MKHVPCLLLMMRSAFNAALAKKTSIGVFSNVMFSRDINLLYSSLSSSSRIVNCQFRNISEILRDVLCVSDHFRWKKGRPVLPILIVLIMMRCKQTTFVHKTLATADEGNYIKVITVGTDYSDGTFFSLVIPVALKKIIRKVSAFFPNRQKVEDAVLRALAMPV